jgi:hypothetical protein
MVIYYLLASIRDILLKTGYKDIKNTRLKGLEFFMAQQIGHD